MCHVLMTNFLMIMEKLLIILQDQKIKSINYLFLCVGRLIFVATSYLDQKIQYHENRTFLFCLIIFVALG